MMAPLIPTVGLDNLGKLALTAPRPARSLARPMSALLASAASLLVWRLASMAEERRRRKTTQRRLMITGGVVLTGLVLARWQMQRLFAHEPPYEVEEQRGLLEIRRYPALRIAETTVDATWEEALQQGFRRLAGFIFGGNDTRQRLAMTAPVLGTGNGAGFRVAFVMPEGHVPAPDDDRVGVRELPARRVAVLRFRGRYDASTIDARKKDLVHELAAAGLHPSGEASFAGYDPPSTLPLLRRNELWVELEPAVSA